MADNCSDYYSIKNINEPHMPVAFVLDISGSMYGKPVDMLNKSVNRFKEQVCADPKAARSVDISIIGFNDSPTIIQNWRSITEMEPVSLSAGGGTNIATALDLAVNKLRERSHLYKDVGIELKMPYLILITDGYGGDVTEVAEVIKQRTAEHKMKLWVLAVEGYDKETVAKLTDGKRVFELVNEEGYDFSDFFDYRTVSVPLFSYAGVPGDSICISDFSRSKGTNIRIPTLDDWLADNS